MDEINELKEKAEKWDLYVKRCKNEECPKCGSKNIEKSIDYIRDIEEEIETFWCKDCKNDWTGSLV